MSCYSLKKFNYHNLDHLNRLSIEQLEHYYYCHPLHHYGLKEQPEASRTSSALYPCWSKSIKRGELLDTSHYCTPLHQNINEKSDGINENSLDESSLIVCENYAPSYTSKKDQFYKIKDDVATLRKSKLIMKQTLFELDRLLEMSCPTMDPVEDVNEDDYNRDIQRSIEITSLGKYLPRTDISFAAKREREIKDEEKEKEKKALRAFGARPVFHKRDKKMFRDKDLLKFDEKVESEEYKKLEDIAKKETRQRSAFTRSMIK